MRKIIQYTVALALLLTIAKSVQAQHRDSIVIRAMRDEITRSMTSLQYKDHPKPFYISYRVNMSTHYNVSASRGALVKSDSFKDQNNDVRVLVGSYEFNDESLDARNDRRGESRPMEIRLPEDSDYYGIRRAFWTITDNVYKSAAETFRKHELMLKEENKKLADLPHRSFARVPVVKMIKPTPEFKFDKKYWEDYCKKLSAVMKMNPAIDDADASVEFYIGTHYFANSEGTVVIEPYQSAHLFCSVKGKDAKGKMIRESIGQSAETPEELPDFKTIEARFLAKIESMSAVEKDSTLTEEYTGPVLLIGNMVPRAFSNALFGYNESLIASDGITGENDHRSESAASSFQSRVGKLIIDNNFTVKAKTKLKTYKGVKLSGAYDVDSEGVVPADEVVLVEKGILKGFLNDRTLTKENQKPTGHADGPGVLEISVDKGSTIDNLKTALIAAAKKEGLEFAIIIRDSYGQGEDATDGVYRVDLTTGKEEKLRSVNYGEVTLKMLKHVAGASAELKASNSVHVDESGVATVIAPDALLLEEMELNPFRRSFHEEEEEYLPNPLSKSTKK